MPVESMVEAAVWPEGFASEDCTVAESEATLVAARHAATSWDDPVAMGPILHVRGVDGEPFAYAVPFARGAEEFPAPAALLGRIGELHRELDITPDGDHWAVPALVQALEDEFGRFGTVYVSASRDLGPVLMVTTTLPPYFFVADLAADAVTRAADAAPSLEPPRLGRLLFAGPHEELLECTVGERTLLLDPDSMSFVEAPDLATLEEHDAAADEGAADAREAAARAWEAALAGPVVLGADDVAMAAATTRTVPMPRRIPPVDWTYWCAPTAWVMAFAYWDTMTPGSGTHLGYGKVVDHWFDHDPTGHNVPNLLDEIIDRTKTPPTWAGDTFAIVNAQGYSFSRSAVSCTAGNGWGWSAITAEIDAGRPLVVGMMSRTTPKHNNHAMVVYGYRVTATGQRFLLLLNTWGTTWEQQSIELASGIWQGLPMIKMGADRLIPGGSAGNEHLVLTSPREGTVDAFSPTDITWYSWGSSIASTRVSVSVDGGRSWRTIADDVPTKAGWNSHRWVPQQAVARCRVKVEGLTASGALVAADGSRFNVRVRLRPLNRWSGWLGLGRPGVAVDDLSVAANADGRLELVVAAADGAVWHRYQAAPGSRSWIGWGSMGTPGRGTAVRTVEAATNADGRLEVLALGTDGAVWHRWQPQPSKGPWNPWVSIGRPSGVMLRRITAERAADGRIQLFAIGDDDQLWTSHQSTPGNRSWVGWTCYGTPRSGFRMLSVDTIANTDGRIEVVVGGGVPTGEFGLTDAGVWLVYQPAPNKAAPWSRWIDLGRPPVGTAQPTPVLGRNADGRLELFVAGPGGALWHRWQPAPGQGPWGGWASRGAPGAGESLLSPLAVERSGDGRLEAFGISARTVTGGAVLLDCRHVWQQQPNDGWSTWGSLGSPPNRSVQWMDAVGRPDGRLEVFALTSEDRAVWHDQQQ